MQHVLCKYGNNPNNELFKGYFTCRILKVWNQIPLEIRGAELSHNESNSPFKRLIKEYYLEKFESYFNDADVCSWVSYCSCARCKAT